jgi:hypothetical protein
MKRMLLNFGIGVQKGRCNMTDELRKSIDDGIEKYIAPLANGKKFVDDLAYLYVRWQDEHEYEDWREYEEVLKRHVPKDCIFVRSTKRPIGIVVKIPKVPYLVHVYAKMRGDSMSISAKVVK